MKKGGLRKGSQRLRVWRRDKKKKWWQKHGLKRPAKKLSHSAAHHCEKHCSAKNPPFWFYSTYIICLWNNSHQASNPPPLNLLRDNFSPNRWMLVWGLAHSPLPELLLGWELCHIKPQSVKDSPRGENRGRKSEIYTTTHLCKAKIGTNQMAPHWMLRCARIPLKDTITGLFFHKMQGLNPLNWEKRVFPQTNSTSAACSNLTDEVTGLTL